MADPGPVESGSIVLLGPPASGKGTQGRLLAELWGLDYLSTGKQLRRELKTGSPLGKQAEPYLETGQYVPDELVLALALEWIKRAEDGWILDGFPRTLPQATELDVFLRAQKENMGALLLEVPGSELQQRVAERRECTSCPWTGTRTQAKASGRCPLCEGELGQRQDDDPENFRMRLQAFEELTSPVADYYESSQRLHRVSGAGTPEDVFQRITAQFNLQ